MASSRKRPSGELVAEVGRFLGSIDLRGKRLAVGLSGGVDSVVLLHVLKQHPALSLSAIHVHHGLSRNAGAWARFCRALCARWGVPLAVRRVKVAKKGKGLEAAAREARYRAFRDSPCDAVALAHNRDDQAETVLMNLLRGTGVRGASGMPPRSRLDGKMLLRPLLEVPRAAILACAREQGHHGRARRHAAARLPRQARARAGSARRAVRAGGMERRAAHSDPRARRQAAVQAGTR